MGDDQGKYGEVIEVPEHGRGVGDQIDGIDQVEQRAGREHSAFRGEAFLFDGLDQGLRDLNEAFADVGATDLGLDLVLEPGGALHFAALPFEVQQQLDGINWTPLTTRVAAGTSIAGIPSPLAATGTSVSFRARQATTVDGVLMQSAWSTVASITATPSGCYLVDDGDRSVYLDASLESDGPREIVQSISVTYGLGATSARVDRTPEAGERGTVVWVTTTAAERDALLAWLDARPVFWIVFPPEENRKSTRLNSSH